MRVLIIIETSSGGSGRHVCDLARGLLDAGDEVHLVYSPRRADQGFLKGIQDSRMRVHDVYMQRAPGLGDLSVIRTVSQIIAEYGPFDIIHSHSSKAGLIGRMVNAHGAARVYTPHCIFTMDPTRSLPSKSVAWVIERALAIRTQKIIAVAESERDHLLASVFSKSAVVYIPNGVDMHFSKSREECRGIFGIQADQVVVGSIGRLAPQKNPQLLLKAFAEVAGRNPRVVLLLVGAGELEEECRSLSHSLNIAQRVIWAGYQYPEDVLPAFDFLAMSSRYEAFPYVLIEALAAGLPIVATSVGGTAETIIEGENGLIVQTQTTEKLAESLWRMIDDSSFRRRCAEQSLQRSRLFTVNAMIQSTRAVYESILSTK